MKIRPCSRESIYAISVVACVMLTAGCSSRPGQPSKTFKWLGPKIYEFTAEPLQTCPGAPVKVTWKTKGRASLASNPGVYGIGDVSESGTRDFRLRQTTKFTLQATRFGEYSSPVQREVVVFEVPSQKQFSGYPRCDGQVLQAEATPSPEKFAEQVRVAQVELPASAGERAITVLHAGREAVLDATHRSSDAFRGTNPTEPWHLSAARLAGEHCRNNDSLPKALGVVVTFECQAESR